MDYKISIIIPCHNSEEYINRCFSSVVNQSFDFTAMEVIMIDDGSTDNTYKILTELSEKYHNVKVFHYDISRRAGGARNIGIQNASGYYISFIDADDFVHPSLFEKMYQKAMEYDCDIVQTKERIVHEETYDSKVLGDDRLLDLTVDSVRREFIVNFFGLSVRARLYKKSYIEKYNIHFPENCAYEDNFVSGIDLFAANSIYLLNEELYFYYPNNKSVMPSNYSSFHTQSRIQIIRDFINELDKLNLLKNANQNFRNELQYFCACRMYLEPYIDLEMITENQIQLLSESLNQLFPDILNNIYLNILQNPSNRDVINKLYTNMKAHDKYICDHAIEICLCVTDRTGEYSKQVCATILSVLLKTESSVRFHIVHDDTLSADNISKLTQAVNEYPRSFIEFHHVEAKEFTLGIEQLERYSIGTLFRLKLPELLNSAEKIIYIDSDIIVNCDILPLWNINIDNYYMAGVHDACFDNGITPPQPVLSGEIPLSDYVNAGVLLMNLKKLRQEMDLYKLSVEYLLNNRDARFPDQDAINILCAGKILLIDEKWNTLTRYQRNKSDVLKEVIYHYTGNDMSFSKPMAFDKLNMQIKAKTPWGSDVSINRLYNGLGAAYFKVEQLQKLLFAISDGKKKRIFWGNETPSLKYITSLIPLRDEDYYVGHDAFYDVDHTRHGHPVKTFEDIKKEPEGSFVVFVLPEMDGYQAISKLEAINLKYGVDFFVIPTLTTVEQGGFL